MKAIRTYASTNSARPTRTYESFLVYRHCSLIIIIKRRFVRRRNMSVDITRAPISAKLHYTDKRTCCTTPPTDELTTILQLVVQQIHHQRTTICHIPTCRDVGLAMWQICCTTSCRIVLSLSVGGVVQYVRSRCPCCGV